MKNIEPLKIKQMVVDFFKDEDVKIVLFGSRARQDNCAFSDVDIGIIPYKKIDEAKVTLLREKIENSNIPYKVKIVNLSDASKGFRNVALKEAVVWKKKKRWPDYL